MRKNKKSKILYDFIFGGAITLFILLAIVIPCPLLTRKNTIEVLFGL